MTDQVSVTLAANRFVSNDPNCPQMIDSLGTVLALSNGLKPTTGAGEVPKVAAFWNQTFSHAQYLILTATNGRRIAWSPQLEAYFASHFRQGVTSLPASSCSTCAAACVRADGTALAHGRAAG